MRRRQGSAAPKAAAASLLAALALINTWAHEPASLPKVHGARVLVLAASLPQPLTFAADHCYFLVKDEGATTWERWEVWQSVHEREGGWGHVQRDLFQPLDDVGGDDPRLLAEFRGTRAAAFIEHLRAEAPGYADRERYLAYPGPNSNTFVDVLLRSGGLPLTLPPTAVGKDYRGLVGASRSSGGTGVQLESPLLGFKLGWEEGVEVHALSLTAGVDLSPPAILLPFGDGRLGMRDR